MHLKNNIHVSLLLITAMLLAPLLSSCAKSPGLSSTKRMNHTNSYRADGEQSQVNNQAVYEMEGDSYTVSPLSTLSSTPSTASSSANKGYRLPEKPSQNGGDFPFQKTSKPLPTPLKPQATTKRMIYYSGNIRQESTHPHKKLNLAEKISRDFGGYTEHRNNFEVTLRVPVTHFQKVFDSLLTLNRVLHKSIASSDITDSYLDLALRVKILRSTLERLNQLMDKAATRKEKLRLLDEITRVSELLDRLETTASELKEMAAYSRISLEVLEFIPKRTELPQFDFKRMQWIDALSPYDARTNSQGEYLPFETPEELVNITKGNPFVSFVFRLDRKFKCSSADGTEIRTRKMDNNPRGSTEYWAQAVVERLGPHYQSCDLTQVGEYRVVRLQAHSPDPSVYHVGIRAVGKHLEVVEIYHPTPDHETRYHEAIEESLKKGSEDRWYL